MSSLKIISYNIDGLNPFELISRTTEIIGLVVSEEPDVVHFQEVVPETGQLLYRSLKLNNYIICGGISTTNFMDLGNYFTLTFIKRAIAEGVKISRIPFSGEASSLQGRDLLQTVVQVNGVRLMSLNCHLESCGTAFKSAESFTRLAQLTQAMRLMVNHDGPAFIAGDLNIRDSEASKVLNEQNSSSNPVKDVAEFLEGGSKKCSPTWFMPNPNGALMRCRFDRIYCNNKCQFIPTSIKQIGSEEMFSRDELFHGGCTYTTPSDHRGLVIQFTYQGKAKDNAASVSTSSSSPRKAVHVDSSSSSKRKKNDRDVIDLCDSSPESTTRKKMKSDEPVKEDVKEVTPATLPGMTNMDRRQLFLNAIQKRMSES